MEKITSYAYKFFNSIDKRIQFAGLVTLFSSTALYIYSDFCSLITTFYKDNLKNRKIIKNCSSINSGVYYQTFYLPCCTPQLFYEEYQKKIQDVKFEKVDVICNDGGQIKLFICVKPKLQKRVRKVLIINHGHTSGASSNYVK